MVWSSSPTRNTSRDSPVSSSTRSSWALSRSCDSSTSSTRVRARQLAKRRLSARSAPTAPATRSSMSMAPSAARAARYAAYAACSAACSGPGPRSGSSVSRVNVSSRRRIVAAGRSPPARRRMIVPRSASRDTSTPADRRMRMPRAWNVRTATVPGATPSGSSALSRRSRSSTAARRLNVTAHTDRGSAPIATRHAMRATSVVVLPLPAGATHSTGPGGAIAAARWSGASRSSRARTDDGSDGSIPPGRSSRPAGVLIRAASTPCRIGRVSPPYRPRTDR